jgi:uncharacterized membrane protein
MDDVLKRCGLVAALLLPAGWFLFGASVGIGASFAGFWIAYSRFDHPLDSFDLHEILFTAAGFFVSLVVGCWGWGWLGLLCGLGLAIPVALTLYLLTTFVIMAYRVGSHWLSPPTPKKESSASPPIRPHYSYGILYEETKSAPSTSGGCSVCGTRFCSCGNLYG